MKKVVLFGATGLVGNELLELLLGDEHVKEIKTISRRPLPYKNTKLIQVINPLENIESLENEITGDVVFCCLGTTMRKAGSKKAFKKVDLELPVEIGRAAKKNNVPKMIVISSIGANNSSKIFYSRVKGLMEEEICKTGIREVYILRPSLLLGKRNDFRFSEELSKMLFTVFGFLMIGKLKKYKAIHARTVAKAMMFIAKNGYKNTILESDVLTELENFN